MQVQMRGPGPAASSFVRKLHTLITRESEDMVAFTADGSAFEVKDPKRFEAEILPKYFRHSRFQSFVRQLNFYNFRKINKEKSVWIYRHELFHRDKPQLMDKLKRKTCTGTTNPNRFHSAKASNNGLAKAKVARGVIHWEFSDNMSNPFSLPEATLMTAFDLHGEDNASDGVQTSWTDQEADDSDGNEASCSSREAHSDQGEENAGMLGDLSLTDDLLQRVAERMLYTHPSLSGAALRTILFCVRWAAVALNDTDLLETNVLQFLFNAPDVNQELLAYREALDPSIAYGPLVSNSRVSLTASLDPATLRLLKLQGSFDKNRVLRDFTAFGLMCMSELLDCWRQDQSDACISARSSISYLTLIDESNRVWTRIASRLA